MSALAAALVILQMATVQTRLDDDWGRTMRRGGTGQLKWDGRRTTFARETSNLADNFYPCILPSLVKISYLGFFFIFPKRVEIFEILDPR